MDVTGPGLQRPLLQCRTALGTSFRSAAAPVSLDTFHPRKCGHHAARPFALIPEVPRVTAAPLPPKNGPRTARSTSDAKSSKVERASGPLIGIPRFYRTCVRETIGPLSHAPKVMEILAERAARREIPTQGRTFAARARPIPIEYCPGALLKCSYEAPRGRARGTVLLVCVGSSAVQ